MLGKLSRTEILVEHECVCSLLSMIIF